MISVESLAANWRSGGALVICRHDPASSGLSLSAVVPAGKLLALAKSLRDCGFTLLDLSTIETAEGFLLTWHFDCLEKPLRVALRVLSPGPNPSCPSLYSVFQGAEWHERESRDFFGVSFPGNPNLAPLLLPSDFGGPPPLRKDPAALAPMAALGVFGTPEILDQAWAALAGAGQSPAREAAPADSAPPASKGGGE
jgi:NADH-quinone oxidoreductase subunit C